MFSLFSLFVLYLLIQRPTSRTVNPCRRQPYNSRRTYTSADGHTFKCQTVWRYAVINEQCAGYSYIFCHEDTLRLFRYKDECERFCQRFRVHIPVTTPSSTVTNPTVDHRPINRVDSHFLTTPQVDQSNHLTTDGIIVENVPAPETFDSNSLELQSTASGGIQSGPSLKGSKRFAYPSSGNKFYRSSTQPPTPTTEYIQTVTEAANENANLPSILTSTIFAPRMVQHTTTTVRPSSPSPPVPTTPYTQNYQPTQPTNFGHISIPGTGPFAYSTDVLQQNQLYRLVPVNPAQHPGGQTFPQGGTQSGPQPPGTAPFAFDLNKGIQNGRLFPQIPKPVLSAGQNSQLAANPPGSRSFEVSPPGTAPFVYVPVAGSLNIQLPDPAIFGQGVQGHQPIQEANRRNIEGRPNPSGTAPFGVSSPGTAPFAYSSPEAVIHHLYPPPRDSATNIQSHHGQVNISGTAPVVSNINNAANSGHLNQPLVQPARQVEAERLQTAGNRLSVLKTQLEERTNSRIRLFRPENDRTAGQSFNSSRSGQFLTSSPKSPTTPSRSPISLTSRHPNSSNGPSTVAIPSLPILPKAVARPPISSNIAASLDSPSTTLTPSTTVFKSSASSTSTSTLTTTAAASTMTVPTQGSLPTKKMTTPPMNLEVANEPISSNISLLLNSTSNTARRQNSSNIASSLDSPSTTVTPSTTAFKSSASSTITSTLTTTAVASTMTVPTQGSSPFKKMTTPSIRHIINSIERLGVNNELARSITPYSSPVPFIHQPTTRKSGKPHRPKPKVSPTDIALLEARIFAVIEAYEAKLEQKEALNKKRLNIASSTEGPLLKDVQTTVRPKQSADESPVTVPSKPKKSAASHSNALPNSPSESSSLFLDFQPYLLSVFSSYPNNKTRGQPP